MFLYHRAGVIPSVLQVFLGVQAGSILVHHTTSKGRMIRWCVWGTLCAVLTLVLALPGIIPINKNLWYETSDGDFNCVLQNQSQKSCSLFQVPFFRIRNVRLSILHFVFHLFLTR